MRTSDCAQRTFSLTDLKRDRGIRQRSGLKGTNTKTLHSRVVLLAEAEEHQGTQGIALPAGSRDAEEY